MHFAIVEMVPLLTPIVLVLTVLFIASIVHINALFYFLKNNIVFIKSSIFTLLLSTFGAGMPGRKADTHLLEKKLFVQ